MPHRLLKILLATSVLLVLLFASVEGFLRVHYGGGHPILLETDASSGYQMKPDQTTVRMGGNLVHINHFSMRADDITAEKPPATERVFFLGDSVTYGSTHIDQASTFTGILQAWLPAHLGHRVQVLNASASAWAISNEVGYLRGHGLFGADQLVLVLNSGDINQSRSDIHDLGDQVYQHNPLAVQEAFDHLVIPRLTARKMDKGAYKEPNDPAAVRQNLELLNQLQAYTRNSQTHLSIVFIPHRTWIHDNQQTSAQPVLVQWARSHDVPLIDTTSVLSHFPAEAITMDGVHLNKEGNALVAQYLENQWGLLTGKQVPDRPAER